MGDNQLGTIQSIVVMFLLFVKADQTGYLITTYQCTQLPNNAHHNQNQSKMRVSLLQISKVGKAISDAYLCPHSHVRFTDHLLGTGTLNSFK